MKETPEPSEYEDDFEEEGKTVENTSRSEQQQKTIKKIITSRKYFLKLSHLKYIGEEVKNDSINDNLCEWPTCMRIKQIDK